ncbi:unnamed protein product [Callosobruchus maculatus]|uniref:Uncharacterized protein n=1 Tax=Callosobruchus maculatus TaxID=64391 RepID=A0A653BRZ1_CALMS|nr:unnamed protein product [Callosobruchus maculatus]
MGKHSKKHRRARKVKKVLSAMPRECEDSSSSSIFISQQLKCYQQVQMRNWTRKLLHPQHKQLFTLFKWEIPLGSHNLKTINFGYNRIPSLGPYVFYYNGYLSLTKIELCQNKIFNVSQKAFKELAQLKMVDLSGNNLTSLEVSTFKSNTKMVKLDLSQNKISFTPFKPFLNSATLETLLLSSNKVDQIYEATFSKLPKLRNLMLNDNSIFFIEQNGFAHLKCLQYLSLANTGVFRLGETMFRNDSYPKIIDLSDTPLANKFDPPLKKVKNNGVANLLTLDRYF